MRETDEQAIETLSDEAAETQSQSNEDPGAGAAGSEGAGAGPRDAAESAPGAPASAETARGAPAAAEHDSEEQAALQVDVDELLQAVAKRDEYLALAQRTQADFENYRKRVAREAALSQQRGLAKLAKELLPAFDNLDRAIEAAAEGDPLLEGVQLVRKELHAALGRVGIESFSPKGERFDPVEHEAVAQQPVEGAESGCVAEVYQSGYRMGEMVIRPARVLVAA